MKNGIVNAEHLDEKTIELFVNESKLVTDRRDEIARHLSQCPGCRAMHEEISRYYDEVDKLQDEQAMKSSHALYAPDRAIRPRRYEEGSARAPQNTALPQRFVRSVRQYPIRWTGGFVLVVAALALLLPKIRSVDSNPAYVRAKDEFLITYNKAGDELWRKHVSEEYDVKKGPGWITARPEEALTTVDVDGDGRNEVLAVFGWMSQPIQSPAPNSIVCFNADGSERWKYEVHRQIVIGGVQYTDDYRVHQVIVGDFDKNNKPVIIIGASHNPWFPNVIVRLNPIDGTFIGEYWHPGVAPFFLHKNLDGEGREELIFAGQNNRLGRACMFVLDPGKIEGYAPTPLEYVPQGVPKGRELYYVVFPATDLIKGWIDIANQVTKTNLRADGSIEIVVLEKIDEYQPEIYYYFDRDMRCIRVRGSDHFAAAYKLYKDQGKIKGELTDAYFEYLRRNVMYWDGAKFVHEPTRVNHDKEVARK
jgi:hypothetical protein